LKFRFRPGAAADREVLTVGLEQLNIVVAMWRA
jgi:hypothetical protein